MQGRQPNAASLVIHLPRDVCTLSAWSLFGQHTKRSCDAVYSASLL